jgi:hypothetical protein
VSELVSGVLFLAPGFLALKVFYLLGAQRSRSEWEWTTWSVIASLPINGIASVLRDHIASSKTTPDPREIGLGLLVGVALGGLAAFGWQIVRSSSSPRAGRLRTDFGSSAWDEALEDAQRAKRQVELVLEDGQRYAGTIRYGGREDNEAEGWVYLVHPEVYDQSAKKFRDARGTHGYLVHRDRIKRLRILLEKMEPGPRAVDDSVPSEASEAS